MTRETIQNVKSFCVMAFGFMTMLGIMWLIAICGGNC